MAETRSSLLVGNMDGIEKSVEKLGFVPDTYSPHFSLVDQATVEYCREKKIKLVHGPSMTSPISKK